jgi:hypothetical protein
MQAPANQFAWAYRIISDSNDSSFFRTGSKTISMGVTDRKSIGLLDRFFRGERGANVVKLHGSLSELEYKDRSLICNLNLNKSSSRELAHDFRFTREMGYYHAGRKEQDGKYRIITNNAGELDVISESMLTGGNKYSETLKEKAGEEKLILFDQALRDLDVLTIIGYGFGDFHINTRLSKAMALNDRLRIVIIDPTPKPIPEFIKQFDYDGKIERAFCGAAQWMQYCKSRTWDLDQIAGLQANDGLRAEVRKRGMHLMRTTR